MVEADLVDQDALGRDAEVRGDLALEADRHVAQTDRTMPGVEQRASDDPDRVGEVDDPGVGVGQRPSPLGDVEHDRNGPQRLGQTARAGRLLADAAARRGDRLVVQPGGLPADPDLDQHGVGAVQRAIQVVGDLERAGVPLALEDPPGQSADDLAAFGDRCPAAPDR